MGSSFNDPVQIAQGKVKECEQRLKSEINCRESAIRNGNYKNDCKNIRIDGILMNKYDEGVYRAEQALRKAMQELADAKSGR